MNSIKILMIALSASLLLWSCSDDDEPTNGNIATISLSTDILQVDKNGGNATVTVTSSGDWQLSGVSDWAHPSVTSGRSGEVVTFTVDPSQVDEKRTATFKFFTGTAVVPLTVESESAYVVNLLSDNDLALSKEENVIQIKLNTNVADLTPVFSNGSEEWLTFDKRVDFGGIATLVFTAAKNETYKNRSASITFSSPLVTTPLNISVNQNQTDAIIPESNDFTFDIDARTLSFKLSYNVDYEITIPKGNAWITNQTISEPVIGDDGLSTVTLTYQLGAATNSRRGDINIAKTDNSLACNIPVIQINPADEPVEFPDPVFRSILVSIGWVVETTDSKCLIFEDGYNATTFVNDNSAVHISSLSGIENFPNLTTLVLGNCGFMEKLDLSGLHHVSNLSYGNITACKEFNFGDNPITSFNAGGFYSMAYVDSFKFIGSKLQTLDLSIYSIYGEYYDTVRTIDVSECPALTTLNANRSSKITTLYMKEGQEIPNLTKHPSTEIVYK